MNIKSWKHKTYCEPFASDIEHVLSVLPELKSLGIKRILLITTNPDLALLVKRAKIEIPTRSNLFDSASEMGVGLVPLFLFHKIEVKVVVGNWKNVDIRQEYFYYLDPPNSVDISTVKTIFNTVDYSLNGSDHSGHQEKKVQFAKSNSNVRRYANAKSLIERRQADHSRRKMFGIYSSMFAKIKQKQLADILDVSVRTIKSDSKAINNPLRIIDLFSGLGGFNTGFQALGHPMSVEFASDIDKTVQRVYKRLYNHEVWGDINAIHPADIPDHDILCGGFPCQPFSKSGLQKGLSHIGKGDLIFSVIKILKAKQPEAFLLENVENLKHIDNGNTFKTIVDELAKCGYVVKTKVLNTADFGLPQSRKRLFFVGFRNDIQNSDSFEFPDPFGYHQPIDDLLQHHQAVPEHTFHSPVIKAKIDAGVTDKPGRIKQLKFDGTVNARDTAYTLTTNATAYKSSVDGVRVLSPKEQIQLQGFDPQRLLPVFEELKLGHTVIAKLCGNSVSVPVITAIAGEMLKVLRK